MSRIEFWYDCSDKKWHLEYSQGDRLLDSYTRDSEQEIKELHDYIVQEQI